jgi:hypothetical protein
MGGLTLVPDKGSFVKAFQIVDTGSIFDENKFIFTQGVFSSGKLNCPNGQVTNYSRASVSIRQGEYILGKENGNIVEYVFPKTDWDAFVDDTTPSISSTRYTHTFNNGSWVSTIDTTPGINIKATVAKNVANRFCAFSFAEV